MQFNKRASVRNGHRGGGNRPPAPVYCNVRTQREHGVCPRNPPVLENQASICPIRDVFTQHADLIFGIRIVHNLHPRAPITCKQLVAGPLNAAPRCRFPQRPPAPRHRRQMGPEEPCAAPELQTLGVLVTFRDRGNWQRKPPPPAIPSGLRHTRRCKCGSRSF
jgi:hypothetical protein